MARAFTFLPILLLGLILTIQHAHARPASIFEKIGKDISDSLELSDVGSIGNGSLPRFNSIGSFYVTGVSSGGYMAGQLHIAYSNEIKGAAIFAAGPWGCASGSLVKALAACTDNTADMGLPALVDAARVASLEGTIDPIQNIYQSPVWLFHGNADATVKKSVNDATYHFYQALSADVVYNNATIANHAWVSPLGANPCEVSASPYTSACKDMDPQAEFLTHILRRKVNPPNTKQLLGTITPFSQDYYSRSKWALDADMLSMDTTGYIYVPPSCATSQCDVVMALHGCLQSVSMVGLDFINQSNLNQYADTNNLIIMYPQAIALSAGVVLNPKSCWDWWSYLAMDSLYAVKGSYQMEVLMSMMRALEY